MILLALAACTSNGGERAQDPFAEKGDVSRPIEEVLKARTPELMRTDGVEGVGQGMCNERPCIRVYIRAAEVEKLLPRQLDGYVVDAVVTGMVRPL
jgi:hypothetical protein